MTRKIGYITIVIVLALLFVAGTFGVGTALAEETEPWVPMAMPGTVEGVGVQFEVTDSEYLNVTLDSTELLTASISSVPAVIELRVEAAQGALETQLTLSGLVPGLEYHLYTDSLENHVITNADESGSLAWTQELIDPHLLFIQTVPSTIFIADSTNGKQCAQVGHWDGTTKTCTLEQDVADTIEIQSSGITLDGDGHKITGVSSKDAGIYIPGTIKTATTGVTVKNLTIEGFANGIKLNNAKNCTLRGNTIINVSNKGIELFPQNVKLGGGNLVTGNQVLGAEYGIDNKGSNFFQRNTIRSTEAALNGDDLGSFYNNNLIDYQYPFWSTNRSQSLSAALPFGGNYWSSFDSAIEGCADLNADGFCDAAYLPISHNDQVAGVDSFPWTTQDGWLDITINAPVDPIMYVDGGVIVDVSANFKDVDVNTSHTAIEWAWGDGTTSPAAVVNEVNGEGEVSSASHIYTSTGVYEITLTMKDNPYLSTVVKSYQYIVIYDPSAGFATGGGWIESPAGAYVPDPTMTGQATFGFIAKFYRTRTGGNELSGNTVFEFHTANLRFTSSSYDWLVVNGSKAIYRGLGYINGDVTKLYSFMLTAQDEGDTGDKFRIQIWDADNGLIYDNKIGALSNDLTAGTVISSGSIIVQTKSK